jgi:hypothetical protein
VPSTGRGFQFLVKGIDKDIDERRESADPSFEVRSQLRVVHLIQCLAITDCLPDPIPYSEDHFAMKDKRGAIRHGAVTGHDPGVGPADFEKFFYRLQ